jgi:hypothetical protein
MRLNYSNGDRDLSISWIKSFNNQLGVTDLPANHECDCFQRQIENPRVRRIMRPPGFTEVHFVILAMTYPNLFHLLPIVGQLSVLCVSPFGQPGGAFNSCCSASSRSRSPSMKVSLRLATKHSLFSVFLCLTTKTFPQQLAVRNPYAYGFIRQHTSLFMD